MGPHGIQDASGTRRELLSSATRALSRAQISQGMHALPPAFLIQKA